MARLGDSLPPPAGLAMLRAPWAQIWGPLLLRPWVDDLAVRAIARLSLPLMRATAVAEAAGGSLERFSREMGATQALNGDWSAFLEKCRQSGDAYRAAQEAWEKAFFGPEEVGAARLVACEVARRRAAVKSLAQPLGRRQWRTLRRLPLIPHPPETPAEAEAWVDAAPTLPPNPTTVVPSRRLASHYGEEFLLRFRSPTLGDDVDARVYQPLGSLDPPSVIFLHGIAMEPEFWTDFYDPVNALTGRGIRVIRPEGPWHGRRRLSSSYGGEPIFARGPGWFLRALRAWSGEVAALISWARRTSGGPVVLAGLSLGSLSAQWIAAAATDGPEEPSPDFLFLIATSGDMRSVLLDGALTRLMGIPEALAKAGWQAADFQRWAQRLAPQGPPALPPERIFMLLGAADRLTPFTGGRALAEDWRVPAENLFIRPHGHFTVAGGLYRDQPPFDRLVDALARY